MPFVKDPQADKEIARLVQAVGKGLLQRVPGAVSVILAGGYGRGEGGWTRENGKILPLNDFDLYVVTNARVSEPELNHIANALVSELGLPSHGVPFYFFDREKYANTFYLDVKTLSEADLPRVLPLVRYYDLREASTVIAGVNLLDHLPSFSARDLPLAEGFRLLLNRMAMLAEYFSIEFFERPPTPNEKRGLLLLGSKAFLGASEALLLLKGAYASTHAARAKAFAASYAKEFPGLAKKLPDLPKRVNQVVAFKDNTDFTQKLDAPAFFFEARDCILQATLCFTNQWLGLSMSSPEQLSDAIARRVQAPYFEPYLSAACRHRLGFTLPASLLLPFARFYLNCLFFLRLLRFHGVFHPRVLLNSATPDLVLFSALPLLLSCIQAEGGLDLRQLSLARKKISQVCPLPAGHGSAREDWLEADKAFCDAYVLYFFQKLV